MPYIKKTLTPQEKKDRDSKVATKAIPEKCSKCESDTYMVDFKEFSADYNEVTVERSCKTCGKREYYIYRIVERFGSEKNK